MSSRDFRLYIVDIFIAINKIGRYTQEFEDGESLRWHEMAWDSTIRELEILGEATRVLLQTNFLQDKKYRKIVDFRNIIAHGYFGLDEEEVFYVCKTKLEELEEELILLLKDKKIEIEKVLELSIEENKKITPLVTYLKELIMRINNAR